MTFGAAVAGACHRPFDASAFSYVVLRDRQAAGRRLVLEVQVVPVLALLCVVVRPSRAAPVYVVNLSFAPVTVRQVNDAVLGHRATGEPTPPSLLLTCVKTSETYVGTCRVMPYPL